MGKLLITKKVEELIAPVLERESLELVDVEFKKEPVGLVLRIFIDSDLGVDLDRCSRVSQAISPILDKADLISGPYTLEVSSPGIERPLKGWSDFQRFVGQKAYVKTFQAIEERRQFTGTIESASPEKLVLNLGKETVKIPMELISKSYLVAEINF